MQGNKYNYVIQKLSWINNRERVRGKVLFAPSEEADANSGQRHWVKPKDNLSCSTKKRNFYIYIRLTLWQKILLLFSSIHYKNVGGGVDIQFSMFN